MAEATRSLDIPAPPAAVWGALADYGSISAWAPDVDHSCLMSEQASGAGAVRRVQVGRIVLVERVTQWEDPERLAYRIEGLPAAISSVTNTWHLEPSRDGTLVSVTTAVNVGPRPPQQLASRAIAARLAKVSDGMLAGLRGHVRAREGSTS
ncbi:MAG: SRPBCC family protein [Actinomycetota bacterium]